MHMQKNTLKIMKYLPVSTAFSFVHFIVTLCWLKGFFVLISRLSLSDIYLSGKGGAFFHIASPLLLNAEAVTR